VLAANIGKTGFFIGAVLFGTN